MDVLTIIIITYLFIYNIILVKELIKVRKKSEGKEWKK